jgi:hypothetical protein
MIQVADYLQLGYRGIVFLEVKDWEEKSGYQDEHTVQKLACFDKDGTPLILVVHWVEKFRPRGGGRSNMVESKEVISQEAYQRLMQEHGVQDDSLYYQKCARNEKKRRDAEHKLMEMTPNCPVCGTRMTIRFRRADSAPFWGCVGFHRGNCRGSRPIAPKIYERYDRLSKIAHQI